MFLFVLFSKPNGASRAWGLIHAAFGAPRHVSHRLVALLQPGCGRGAATSKDQQIAASWLQACGRAVVTGYNDQRLAMRVKARKLDVSSAAVMTGKIETVDG